LRPIWINPHTPKWKVADVSELAFYPVICLSVSRVSSDNEENQSMGREYLYIQGAADDHESWSLVSLLSSTNKLIRD
jgi:hypothetical protein